MATSKKTTPAKPKRKTQPQRSGSTSALADPDVELAERLVRKAQWLARVIADPDLPERERGKYRKRLHEAWASVNGTGRTLNQSHLIRELVRESGEDLYWGLDEPVDESTRARRRREAVRVTIKQIGDTLPGLKARLVKHRELVEAAVLACEHKGGRGQRLTDEKRKRPALEALLRALELPYSDKAFRRG